jgi:hypothetical protein
MKEPEDEQSPNPPFMIGAPVPEMTRAELIAWHAATGTLKEYMTDLGRD